MDVIIEYYSIRG